MALVVWLTVLIPALWAGLLLAKIYQGILALALPALLEPAHLVGLHDYTLALAVFGVTVAAVGNFLIGMETGFLYLRRLWVDNFLVYLGVAAWLVASLLAQRWWLPLAGQGVAALLMLPQLALLIARATLKGDAFFVAVVKLLCLTVALVCVTVTVGWLGL